MEGFQLKGFGVFPCMQSHNQEMDSSAPGGWSPQPSLQTSLRFMHFENWDVCGKLERSS